MSRSGKKYAIVSGVFYSIGTDAIFYSVGTDAKHIEAYKEMYVDACAGDERAHEYFFNSLYWRWEDNSLAKDLGWVYYPFCTDNNHLWDITKSPAVPLSFDKIADTLLGQKAIMIATKKKLLDSGS